MNGERGNRRPPGESFESFVERQIREAQAEGQFDDLPDKGKPGYWHGKPYSDTWWLEDKLRREHLSALPESIAIKHTVEDAVARALAAPTDAAARRILEEVNDKIRRLNRTIVDGPPTTVAPLDVEGVLSRRRR